MRAVFVSCFLVLVSAPAFAEMPDYDVKRHCDRVSKMGGSQSQMLFNACFDQEQDAYNSLKPRWDSLPQSLRSHCDNVARIGGGGSFTMLGGCVQQEESAAKANAGRTFKR